ncbi:hypothetical protein AB7645_42920 [Bradyrhizobium sp. 956_D2_N1_5]|uniref:hypothetical protein n=2 Tax=Nitrobacteraceae TaxID=41294 RepID=UPI003F298D59
MAYEMVDRDHIATIQFTDFNGRVRVVAENPDGSWTYFPRDHSKWVYGCFNNNRIGDGTDEDHPVGQPAAARR